jgi:hypothetical protein
MRRFSNVTAQDVLQGLHDQETKPDPVVELSTINIPTMFVNAEPQLVLNMFPVDAGYIVPLYVAKERGLDLREVDFVLGGSALSILAAKDVDRDFSSTDEVKYLVQKCPTTNIIVLAKSRIYTANHADIGAQFQRLVTGRPMIDELDLRTFESLHLIKVSGYTVLFATEVEAVDESGMPVKLRSGRPRFTWNSMKVMFQMLSSGSRNLILGDRRGPILREVRRVSFDEVTREHSPASLEAAGNNIGDVLRELKRSTEITADAATELDFQEGQMVLRPCPSGDLLPSESVVKELLGVGDLDTARAEEEPGLLGAAVPVSRGLEPERQVAAAAEAGTGPAAAAQVVVAAAANSRHRNNTSAAQVP